MNLTEVKFENNGFWNRAEWVDIINIMPKRCYISDEIIWPFKKAFRGTTTWSGPGFPAFEEHFVTEEIYTFLILKGKINVR